MLQKAVFTKHISKNDGQQKVFRARSINFADEFKT